MVDCDVDISLSSPPLSIYDDVGVRCCGLADEPPPGVGGGVFSLDQPLELLLLLSKWNFLNAASSGFSLVS